MTKDTTEATATRAGAISKSERYLQFRDTIEKYLCTLHDVNIHISLDVILFGITWICTAGHKLLAFLSPFAFSLCDYNNERCRVVSHKADANEDKN